MVPDSDARSARSFAGLVSLMFAVTVFAAEGPQKPPSSVDSKSGKHLFVLSGQSNMRQPLIGTFAETVKKALGENRVIVVNLSHPSQPIRRWYKKWKNPAGVKPEESDGKLYDDLLAAVKKAVKSERIATTTFVWMQGEADAERGWASQYEESFFGILDQFKADLGVTDMRFVLGRINDYWLKSRGIVDGEAVRALQVKIGESSDKGAWVDTDDLNTGVNPWGVYEIDGGHFPNAGYRVLGQRFARAACKLADPAVKVDESLFDAVFLDDARKVKTHLALEKPVTGTPPHASYSGGTAGLLALSDGKLGTSHHGDPSWLGFSPEQKNIELVVDLGKSSEVASVSINVLTDHEVAAHLPSQVTLSISENGKDYQFLGSGRNKVISIDKHARQKNLDKSFKPRSSLVFIENPTQKGRYVKVEIAPDASGKAWLFVDEIMVNPALK